MFLFKQFFKSILIQVLQIAIPVLFLSVLFISIPTYEHFKLFSLNENLTTYVLMFIKISTVFLSICVGLSFTLSSFSMFSRIAFSFLFFSFCMLRTFIFYPSIADTWIFFEKYPRILKFLQHYLDFDLLKKTVEWAPFSLIAVCLLYNIFLSTHRLLKQHRVMKVEKFYKRSDVFDSSSRQFSYDGTLLFLCFVCGGLFLSLLTPTYNIFIKYNKEFKDPHVFLFVIDNFPMNALSEKSFQNVMPFLKQKTIHAEIFAPMLSSHAETRRSWLDIVYGKAVLDYKGINYISSKNKEPYLHSPFFDRLQNSGYKVLFASDLNDTKNKTFQKEFILTFPPLLSVLMFPKWQRFFPGFLDTALFSDPRSLEQQFANKISTSLRASKPVFMTMFFSLDNLDIRNYPTQSIHKVYHYSLNSIDHILQTILTELEKKQWLKNSLIVVMGTHGKYLENFKDAQTSLPSVKNDYEFLTPFILIDSQKYLTENRQTKPIRTIDVAPTILKKIFSLPMDIQEFEGRDVTTSSTITSNFSSQFSYRESYSNRGVDRALLNNSFKIVLSSSQNGNIVELFHHEDHLSKHNLLAEPEDQVKHNAIKLSMLQELNEFLLSRNIEVVYNDDDSFFYAENKKYD